MTMIQTGWPGVTLSPLTTPTPLNPPFEWLVIDIETDQARPEDVEAWVRNTWAPSPGWKVETAAKRYMERLEKQKELAALIDQSPIRVVSLKSPTETRVLHDLYQHPPKSEAGALVESFTDEAGMMRALAGLLETRTSPETILAGHNIIHFDLPKIRRSMLANGVPLPAILAAKSVEVFDTMVEWGRRFSLSGSAFTSLDVVLESLGLASHKSACDGSKVGELIAAGEFDTLIKYALLDVAAETDVFLKMTGRA